MAYQSITQILLIVIAVVVIFTYVRPKLAEISQIQDEVAQYEEAVNKATEFNQLLASLLSQSADFSQEEIKALERYLPSEFDGATVARDLSIVANQANVVISSIALEEVAKERDRSNRDTGVDDSGTETGLLTQNITISIIGQYADAKEFISLVENNAYPLELVSLVLDGGQGDIDENANEQFSFTLIYETYSLATQI